MVERLEVINVTDYFYVQPVFSVNKSDSHLGGNTSVQDTHHPTVIVSGGGGADTAPIIAYIFLGLFMLFVICLLITYLQRHVHADWICRDCMATDERYNCCEEEEV